MDTDTLIERIKAILTSPATEWAVIEPEATNVADLYRNYIAILAALPPVFGFVKGSLLGYGVPLVGTMRLGIGAGLATMLIGYALGLLQVYVMALIVDALAPTFAARRDPQQALKLVAYSFTAAWVAAIALVVPFLGPPIALVGSLYSIYLFYLGLPVLMKAPQEQTVAYTAVCIIMAIVTGAVIGFCTSALTGGAAARISQP